VDIYLDMNIFVSYIKQENIDLVKSLNYAIKNTTKKFPYSPAHIEEIAVINRKSENSKRYISQNLKIISKICKDYEYLPTISDGIKTSNELPSSCYKRVLEDYSNTTIRAEDSEKEKTKDWKSIQLSLSENELNSIKPVELFTKKEIVDKLTEYLDKKLLSSLISSKILGKKNNLDFNLSPLYAYLKTKKMPSVSILQNNHKIIEILFELIFDFLDNIGYKNDKRVIRKEKYRSRMHDVTHSIYATKANYLITNDENFKCKTIAIYQLLNFNTTVISLDNLDILTN